MKKLFTIDYGDDIEQKDAPDFLGGEEYPSP